MSYLVLARKWRPKTFADTVGQEHVRQALTNALSSQRLHHAYLFSGTRGVGKTTIARVFAKALNCDTGVSAEPCGTCGACTEIDEGRYVDLIEVDAASRTGIDDMRELLENVQYTPAGGRYKVYLIDEVHMLSKHSFNALLKTLEEPPEHVKFLLATTDPQKLPVTVLSRCLQFNLTRLTPALIQARMAEICTAESIDYDEGALVLLARAAAGSMRDGLSLLDQAIAFGAGSLREADTRRILGTVDRNEIEQILEHLAADDSASLMQTVVSIDQMNPDYSRLLDELTACIQRAAVYQATGTYDTDADPDTDFIARTADAISAEDLQLFYQIALIGKRDLPLAPDPRAGFEMSLLRMLAFKPNGSGGKAAAPGKPERAKVARKDVYEKPPIKEPAITCAVESADTNAEASNSPESEASNIPTNPDWFRIIPELSLSGVERMLASNCAWTSSSTGRIELSLDERGSSQYTEERRIALERALAKHFDCDLVLHIAVGGAAETPAQRVVRKEDEQMQAARQAINDDPNVKVMQDLFGAEVDPDSVHPL
ncbi:MAG: DNA polymerase III subunit gamma/tau [Pseudomonadota bacterium]